MKELSPEERERMIVSVTESKNSEGWYYVRKEINERINQELRVLRLYELKGMTNEQVESYNRRVDKIAVWTSLLNIHEDMIDANLNILERIKKTAVDSFANVESFLKNLTH